MVRIIMGTLVDISKSENKMSIKDIIAAKDRNFAGRTLSAKPIRYNEILNAVATKRVIPMAPPIGKPSDLESM